MSCCRLSISLLRDLNRVGPVNDEEASNPLSVLPGGMYPNASFRGHPLPSFPEQTPGGGSRKVINDPMHPAEEPKQLRNAVRCGAKTRTGKPCQSPSVAGRRRCRMHGGVEGSGGPKGARNGNYKHGRYTAETIATRRWLRHRIREVRAFTRKLRQL